jgi:hypothetical protein
MKVYDKTHRLRQRPVIYYLAPAGIRYLKKAGYDKTNLHYKNKTFTDQQIDEQFLLGRLARAVRSPYGKETFSLHTKYQLGTDTFYLSPPPYALLTSKRHTHLSYFIEYLPAFYPSWKLRRRINQHISRADEYDGYIYPHLLLVCGNQSTEKRVIGMTEELYTDFEVFTTTQERLLSGDKKIWLRPDEVDWNEELEFVGLQQA